MRIVFCGSPDFSIPSLRAVHKEFGVTAVITQPDRIMGKRVTSPVIKKEAESLGIPVYQFEKVSVDGFETLVNLQPDVIITCAFGQFLYRKVLALPKYGVINVHGSILPKYRGASPIQSAILNGEKETGVSIMRTAFEMDSGDVLLCKKTEILPNESAGELFDRLSLIGADALVEGLKLIFNGNAIFIPQDHTKACFCSSFDKKDGLIDFSKSAEEISNKVRAFNPWPSAYTYLPDGKLFKLHSVRVLDEQYPETGKVVKCDKEGIVVSTGSGSLYLECVQEEGGKRMDSKVFSLGHSLLGEFLGNE